MPTPVKAFTQLAARLGGVDPDDHDAVVRWFSEELPKLPPETIRECLETLLAQDGHADEDAPDVAPCYPPEAPLPSLKDAPPARAPTIARLWRYWLTRLFRRRPDDTP